MDKTGFVGSDGCQITAEFYSHVRPEVLSRKFMHDRFTGYWSYQLMGHGRQYCPPAVAPKQDTTLQDAMRGYWLMVGFGLAVIANMLYWGNAWLSG